MITEFKQFKQTLNENIFSNDLNQLLNKHNVSQNWFKKIIDLDELTEDELDDLDFIEDRIMAHLSHLDTHDNTGNNLNNYFTEGKKSDKQYKKDVEAYKFFVVNISKKKVESGWEFKNDAKDALKDFDGDKNYKVVTEKELDKLDIKNPKEKWMNESFKVMSPAKSAQTGLVTDAYELSLLLAKVVALQYDGVIDIDMHIAEGKDYDWANNVLSRHFSDTFDNSEEFNSDEEFNEFLERCRSICKTYGNAWVVS